MLTFDNLIIDRVLSATFENANHEILCTANQIQDFSVNTTSETKDKTDANGILIKRFYTAKSVEVSGENAVFSLSLAATQFGTELETENVQLPRIIQVKASELVAGYKLPETPVEGTISVYGCVNNIPNPLKKYELAAELAEGKYTLAEGTIKIAEGATDDIIQIKYEYIAEDNAIKAVQKGDKFPTSTIATFQVLVCDACDVETLRHAYIVFPHYQMSPDFDWSFTTDATHSFSGTAQSDYCAPGKDLFYIAMSDDDIAE